jgi:hypothetical protein
MGYHFFDENSFCFEENQKKERKLHLLDKSTILRKHFLEVFLNITIFFALLRKSKFCRNYFTSF